MLAFFPFAPYAVQQEAISFLKCCVASKTPAFLDAPTGTGKTAILFHLAWDWINSLEKSADTSSRAESMQSNVSSDRSNVDGLPVWAVDAGEKAIVESVMASRSINRAFVKQLLQVAEAYGAPSWSASLGSAETISSLSNLHASRRISIRTRFSSLFWA